jgi:two-component system cell cycle sensor histidine kinase/response regulator CckA
MAPASHPINKAGSTTTILVVDDEDLIRTMIGKMLKPMGYCILHAANGSEALTICEHRNGAIHLIVTEVTMPGIDGVNLAAHATERWPTIKILFMTGFATDAAIRRRTSNHPLLSKPFTRDQLTGEVQELLNRSPTGV